MRKTVLLIIGILVLEMFPIACVPHGSFPPEYYIKVLNTQRAHLIGYWPLWDAVGPLADDLVSSSYQTANALINPGFESPTVGVQVFPVSWQVSPSNGAIAAETTIVHGGAVAVKLTAGAAAATYVRKDHIRCTPGDSCTFSFWTRGDGTYAGRYFIQDFTHAATIKAQTSTGGTGTEWTQVSYSFVVPAGCYQLLVDLWCPSTNGGIAYFDDVILSGCTQSTDGVYVKNGVTYGEPGIGDGKLSVALDGTSSYVMIGTEAFNRVFNGNKGSAIAWGKVSAASVWTDNSEQRYLFHPKSAIDERWYLAFGKTNDASHTLAWVRRASMGSNLNKQYTFPAGGPTGWFCQGMIWDLASSPQRIACFLWDPANGFQKVWDYEPDTGNESWDQDAYPLIGKTCLLMAGYTTSQEWMGWGAHVACWNDVLTDAEMQSVMML